MLELAAATLGAAPRKAVLSVPLDAAAVGGLSLIALVVYAASGTVGAPANVFERVAILTALVNHPHIVASYGLLYGGQDPVRRYPFVSVILPVGLLIWMVIGEAFWVTTPQISNLLTVLSCVLLAFHYTGQTFGMMASFSFVDGTSFSPSERHLVRVNLLTLRAWHVFWALGAVIRTGATDAHARDLVSRDLRATIPLALGSMIFGAIALVQMRRRTGRLPGARVIMPWLAIHGWYALIALDDRALFLAQISHAVQYLPFPLRVHLNRTAGSARSPVVRTILYLGALLIGGQAAFEWIPDFLHRGVNAIGWHIPPFTVAVGTILNIHHYFVDGVVWKISNPQVRKELFAHLIRPAAAAPAPIEQARGAA